jgi:hypothetical protein
LEFAAAASFSFWFQVDNIASTYALFGKYTFDTQGEYFIDLQSETIIIRVPPTLSGDGGATRNTFTTAGLSNNTWAHVVIVYDGGQGTPANRVKLFANGAEISALSYGTIPATMNNGTASFTIGRWPGLDRYPTGKMSGIYVWSRVLTAGERSDLYASGAGLFY